jgi:transcriptional regulatory protein RtcR
MKDCSRKSKGGAQAASELDLFDRVQLAEVLRICQQAPTLAAAGRQLFAESRQRKATRNDSDRLKKYLARFELDWGLVHSQGS